MAKLTTTGIPEIDRRLEILGSRVANRITRQSLNKGLTVLAQAERTAVDAEPNLSTDARRALKKTISKRLVLQNARGRAISAKAGFGVGQKPRGSKSRARAAARESAIAAKRDAKGAKGVGLTANNVHWFALGTEERHQPYRRKRSSRLPTSKNVGRLAPVRAIRRSKSSLSRVLATIKQAALEKIDQAVRQLRSQ